MDLFRCRLISDHDGQLVSYVDYINDLFIFGQLVAYFKFPRMRCKIRVIDAKRVWSKSKVVMKKDKYGESWYDIGDETVFLQASHQMKFWKCINEYRTNGHAI